MRCTVRKGRRYRAKLQIPFFERPLANEGVISERLKDAGFQTVNVVSSGSGTYWAFGTWPLEDRAEDVDYVVQFDEVA